VRRADGDLEDDEHRLVEAPRGIERIRRQILLPDMWGVPGRANELGRPGTHERDRGASTAPPNIPHSEVTKMVTLCEGVDDTCKQLICRFSTIFIIGVVLQ
jgi:hypothetical protein